MKRALLCLLLAGCTTWVHPNKDEQAFNADRYECEKDAAAVRDPWQSMAMQTRCMQVKGWKAQ